VQLPCNLHPFWHDPGRKVCDLIHAVSLPLAVEQWKNLFYSLPELCYHMIVVVAVFVTVLVRCSILFF
jgi:hypothetical protein